MENLQFTRVTVISLHRPQYKGHEKTIFSSIAFNKKFSITHIVLVPAPSSQTPTFVTDVQTIEKQAVAEATLFEAERFREIRPRVQCEGEESAEHNDNVTVGEKKAVQEPSSVLTVNTFDALDPS
ncbi:hypothetical protein QJS10_CPB12g00873 [Acorus calamus]|uniref:Uncharacterized protein n=1 Tax=Acorus calamus TaxID=4465 RepID=A0AAV9DMS2_ACOCL|nr:hypothetical protein QJS10_CPB12g00873 [Acorus calamus]